MGESAEEQEAQMALMDAGAALAETFEALLREFLLLRSTTTTKTTLQTRMRRMRMMLQEEEPTTTTAAELLLPQLSTYQGTLAAWMAVTPPMHVLLAQLSSILEDRLRTRERLLCDLRAVGEEAEREEEREELNRRLARIDDVIRAVRDRLSAEEAAAVVTTTSSQWVQASPPAAGGCSLSAASRKRGRLAKSVNQAHV
jgi:hypothetical protein